MDPLNPIYCTRCKKQIPDDLKRPFRGLCDDCSERASNEWREFDASGTTPQPPPRFASQAGSSFVNGTSWALGACSILVIAPTLFLAFVFSSMMNGWSDSARPAQTAQAPSPFGSQASTAPAPSQTASQPASEMVNPEPLAADVRRVDRGIVIHNLNTYKWEDAVVCLNVDWKVVLPSVPSGRYRVIPFSQLTTGDGEMFNQYTHTPQDVFIYAKTPRGTSSWPN